MCLRTPSLKPLLPIAWLLLLATFCYAQQPVSPSPAEALHFAELKQRSLSRSTQAQSSKPAAPEICDNGTDDDGNGLIDMKDFTCYYSSINTTCLVSKVVWSATSGGLLWADMETGTERVVGNIGNIRMADLAWSSAGRLYGVTLTSNAIYEIDPYTSTPSFAGIIAPYFTANAMTADGSGNLFLAASNTTSHDIIKLNIASGLVTKVADLRVLGLVSAGDLTFLGGFLYLSCAGSQMAKININTGQVQVIATSFFTTGAYGMFTMGDGFLYLGVGSSIYKMDPVTMVADNTPYYTFVTPASSTLGFSNYTEQCNAPACRAIVDIDTLTAAPFCSNTGVVLKAKGSGITGTTGFKWTFPNGSTATTEEITATIKGKYKVRYHAVPDTCGIEDSVVLDIKKTPVADIGPDTIICPSTQVRLEQKDKTDIDTYRWQDGSTQSFFIATQPGRYTLQVSNACGTSSDFADIQSSPSPQLELGNDLLNCPGPTKLFNQLTKQSGEKYLWSTGATTDTISVLQPGIYWLESATKCETKRDSITVAFKDSCICTPFFAAADLGADKLICEYEEIHLRNALHKPGYRYRWQNGSTDATFTPRQQGVYWVDVSTYCGTVRDSITVQFKSQGCERKILFPTAFSPNNDRTNETYKPIVYGVPSRYELTIYNRWGQIVFRNSDPSRGWDGTVKGKKQDTGIFIWTCTYQFSGEEVEFRKGTLTLVQ
jgi:gliding motility-associated-like protein